MKGIKRNLLYWGYTMEMIAGVVTVMIFFVSVVTGLSANRNFFKLFLEQFANLFLMINFLTVIMIAMSAAITYIPFTLSMGSTRRDSFISMEIMLFVLELEMLAGGLVSNEILAQNEKRPDTAELFLFSIVIMIITVGMGNLISLFCLRFGGIVGVVVYLLLTLAGLGVILYAAVAYKGELLQLLNSGWTMAAAVVFTAVTIALHWLVARKIEVKV